MAAKKRGKVAAKKVKLADLGAGSAERKVKGGLDLRRGNLGFGGGAALGYGISGAAIGYGG